MRIYVYCTFEDKTIAHMDVEAPQHDYVTAEMINESWEAISEEYEWDHPAESGEIIRCPACGGPLTFHSQQASLSAAHEKQG